MIFQNGEMKWRSSGAMPLEVLEQELSKFF